MVKGFILFLAGHPYDKVLTCLFSFAIILFICSITYYIFVHNKYFMHVLAAGPKS